MHDPRYPRNPQLVDVQDWRQWPYVAQAGRPNVAAFPPRGYPTLRETNAYYVLGHPPRRQVVNHALHVVLSIITGGFWIPVWFTLMIITHTRNSRAEADYWFRIDQFYRREQWELNQRRALNQGG